MEPHRYLVCNIAAEDPSSVDIHKISMRAITSSDLNHRAPRSDASLLWRNITGNTYIMTAREGITFDDPQVSEVSTFTYTPESALSFDMVASCVYSPPTVTLTSKEKEVLAALGYARTPNTVGGNRRKVRIPEDQLVTRMTHRLEAVGLSVRELKVTSQPDYEIGRQKYVPSCHIRGTVIGDPSDIARFLTHGFGKGKNYGLGMPIPLTIFNQSI